MGMELIETVTVDSGGAASITFASIAADWTDLRLELSGRDNGGDVQSTLSSLKINASTSDFTFRFLRGNGSGVGTGNGYFGFTNGGGSTANTFGSTSFYIANYASSNAKSLSVDSVTETNGTTAYQSIAAVLWNNTDAITSIELILEAGKSFVQYSTASLYGII
jgi:hypothetical protein